MTPMQPISGTGTRNSPDPSQPRPFTAASLVGMLLVLTIPVGICIGLVTLRLEADPFSYAPQWTDEVYNWHQIATYRTAGFEGGYYTVNEEPAPLSSSHFYNHGPVYPMFIGTLTGMLDWELYSVPLLNMLFTTLALVAFVLITRPDPAQTIMLGLTLLTFWPIHLFMASDMRFSFFSSFAIVLAAMFVKTILEPDRVSRFFIASLGITILLVTLSKVSWSFLFLPYLLHLHQRFHLSRLQSIAAGSVLLAISFGVYSRLAAPYPNFASDLIQLSSHSPLAGLYSLMAHIVFNVRNFIDVDHHPLWLMVRVQMLIAIAWSVRLLWKEKPGTSGFREGAVIAANSGLLVVFTILFYDVFGWRDYRLFAPVLLFATLILISRRRTTIVSMILLGNLLVVPQFFDGHLVFSAGRFSADKDRLETFIADISPVIKFDSRKNAWQNTLLAPLGIATDPLMVGIPAGIGISWFEVPSRLEKVKSGYLLLDSQGYLALRNQVDLRFVKRTSIGNLYINREANSGLQGVLP